MKHLTVKAPAKINLRLKVVGKRSDGYHYLSMLNEKLTVADTLFIEQTGPIVESKDCQIDLKCPGYPDLETDSNLIVKAAKALAKHYNISSPLKIMVKKETPMGGGLGGGSSDAAATILALNRIWDLRKPREELKEIAVTIGADVPFFLFDGPAKVTGIGEIVDTNVKLPKLWVLLVNPGFGISTKEVYESLDLKLTEKIESDRFPTLFNDLAELATFIDNDLERVVTKRYPVVSEIEAYLDEKGATVSFMSGSGSTVVGLFESKEKRDAAVSGARKDQWKFFPTENLHL